MNQAKVYFWINTIVGWQWKFDAVESVVSATILETYSGHGRVKKMDCFRAQAGRDSRIGCNYQRLEFLVFALLQYVSNKNCTSNSVTIVVSRGNRISITSLQICTGSNYWFQTWNLSRYQELHVSTPNFELENNNNFRFGFSAQENLKTGLDVLFKIPACLLVYQLHCELSCLDKILTAQIYTHILKVLPAHPNILQ
jgi:hypothetical protein